MRILSTKIMTAVAANATSASNAIDCNQLFKLSAQVIASSGTSNGTLQLQVSNDIQAGNQNFGNLIWTNWSNLGSAVTVNAAGSTLIAQQDMCYKALRALYTDASGGTASATITVQIFALGI